MMFFRKRFARVSALRLLFDRRLFLSSLDAVGQKHTPAAFVAVDVKKDLALSWRMFCGLVENNEIGSKLCDGE